jgi:cytochrome b
MKDLTPATPAPPVAILRGIMDQTNQAAMTRMRVWDFPLRAFHWLLVAAVAAAVVTGQIGGNLIDWHGRMGALVLGLIVFRILWGFLGSTYARFARFLPRPSAIWAYVTGHWRGIGHNPLGALSVLAILAVVATLAVTGLFANDDIAFQGPLFGMVTKDFSDSMTAIHSGAFNALVALIGLHVAAIIFYARARGDNLVIPMITGYKSVPVELAEPVRAAGHLRTAIAVIVAAAIAWSVGSGWIVEQFVPPPAPPAAAPGW